jgi:SEC-C motif-containing protein
VGECEGVNLTTTDPGHGPCVCGSGKGYRSCCGPLHDGAAADTAEALMRSRYSAFALGLEDHLFRTWHPGTRPDGPYTSAGLVWRGLTVLRTEDGGPGDSTGVVEFEARYAAAVDGAEQVLKETSRFERRAGRWVYVDAAP